MFKGILLCLVVMVGLLVALPLLAAVGLIFQFGFVVFIPLGLVAVLLSPGVRRWLNQPQRGVIWGDEKNDEHP